MKTKLVFVSDFFKKNLIGGAELNDDVLINYLNNNNFEVQKINSSHLTEEDVIKNNLFIISNFVNIPERIRQMIMLKKYIIYEHDHKYLKRRDPSGYANFLAPESDIVNKQFYEKAYKVVVLSKICKEVIEKNLKITNVHNIGCSLWSDKKLDFISSINKTQKTKQYCIINSNNVIKGTREAVEYCNKNDIKFELIQQMPENNLLSAMSQYEIFVFFPHVLETLSRVVVEAKMLNCKVMTITAKIGAASESWFSLSGDNLINEIRKKRDAALLKFKEFLSEEQDVTVILNCYRRPEYLQQQIEAIRAQTIKPKQIWLWVNYHEDNKDVDFEQFDVDRVFKNNFNWKFYGRFAGAMMADTKYVAMFDDDTVPGKKWFENCFDTMKQKPGILGGAGVMLNENKYYGHKRTGWIAKNKSIEEVDLVGHAWFFEKEWLKYLWMEKPFTWENGEDIQFSYMAQKYGGVMTYCPPHPESDIEMHSSLHGYEMGVDKKASSNSRNHLVFYAQRDACVKNAIINGWKPIFKRK